MTYNATSQIFRFINQIRIIQRFYIYYEIKCIFNLLKILKSSYFKYTNLFLKQIKLIYNFCKTCEDCMNQNLTWRRWWFRPTLKYEKTIQNSKSLEHAPKDIMHFMKWKTLEVHNFMNARS